jgi:protein-L-isoaspartate(D-aspartate) O-methyltransferase
MDQKLLMEYFRQLDRSLFIDNEHKNSAGLDMPLPIGSGQTISQPSLVAEMTSLLDPNKESKVLEIGTGSGYQTAFLSEFSKEVYTVERFQEFTDKARTRLKELGYSNVQYKTGDGSEGWSEFAPFDRIIVTAAAGTMPDTLVSQLREGGRMVVPVGNPGFQVLKLVCKDMDGTVAVRDIEMVRFVEMTGRYGWK